MEHYQRTGISANTGDEGLAWRTLEEPFRLNGQNLGQNESDSIWDLEDAEMFRSLRLDPGWRFGLCRLGGTLHIYFQVEEEMANIRRSTFASLALFDHLKGTRRKLCSNFTVNDATWNIMHSIPYKQLSDNMSVVFSIHYWGPEFGNVLGAEDRGTLISSLACTLNHAHFATAAVSLYSCRDSETNEVCCPLVVYVNETILRDRSDYLRDMFDPESVFKRNDDLEARISDYDYLEDSDLEELEHTTSAASEETHIPPTSEIANLSLSDSVPPATAGIIRQLAVRDAAHNTWAALVLYLYSDHITFAPLQSSVTRSRTGFFEKHKETNPNLPVPCSPKSMFRLADKIGLNDLENLAFDAFSAEITLENVVEEYFTWFASKYDRVRTFLLESLSRNMSRPEVRQSFRTTGSALADRPYIAELLIEAAIAFSSSKQ